REEATHVVAPEAETTEAKAQARPERAEHATIVGFGVTAPVQGIALGTGPGAACPDQAVTMRAFGDLGRSTMVAQWVQVVLVPACLAGVVQPAQRGALSEIHLDRGHSQLEQASELLLIPGDAFRVRKIEHGIFGG